jgi:hypothetical protein
MCQQCSNRSALLRFLLGVNLLVADRVCGKRLLIWKESRRSAVGSYRINKIVNVDPDTLQSLQSIIISFILCLLICTDDYLFALGDAGKIIRNSYIVTKSPPVFELGSIAEVVIELLHDISPR